MWGVSIADFFITGLRFFTRAAIIISGIEISALFAATVGRLVWFTWKFLDRTIFNTPW